MTEIGKKIKERREELSKSQRELAADLGIVQSQLSQVETGKPTTLTVEKLEFICDYLEIKHTKGKLKETKNGILQKVEKIEERPPKNNLVELIEKKYEESRELSVKHEIAAGIYQEVIELIEENAE